MRQLLNQLETLWNNIKLIQLVIRFPKYKLNFGDNFKLMINHIKAFKKTKIRKAEVTHFQKDLKSTISNSMNKNILKAIKNRVLNN